MFKALPRGEGYIIIRVSDQTIVYTADYEYVLPKQTKQVDVPPIDDADNPSIVWFLRSADTSRNYIDHNSDLEQLFARNCITKSDES